MTLNDHCANCGVHLSGSDGVSGLYNPSGPDILLCVPCFHSEDALIDAGTNDHPELLAHYLQMIEKNG